MMNASFVDQNRFYFFFAWVSFQEQEAFFSSSLPLHSLPKLFGLQRSQLLERLNHERKRCKRI